MTCKLSKAMTQTKLTSLYKNNIATASKDTSRSSWATKSNNSEDCIIVEKRHSYHNRNSSHSTSSFKKVEEEERAHGNPLGAKRVHREFNSPIIDNTKSPSTNEDAKADVSGNGFVTAKAKLVAILSLPTLPLF